MGADFPNFFFLRYNRNSTGEGVRSPGIKCEFRSRKLRILLSLPNSAQESRIQFVTI